MCNQSYFEHDKCFERKHMSTATQFTVARGEIFAAFNCILHYLLFVVKSMREIQICGQFCDA